MDSRFHALSINNNNCNDNVKNLEIIRRITPNNAKNNKTSMSNNDLKRGSKIYNKKSFARAFTNKNEKYFLLNEDTETKDYVAYQHAVTQMIADPRVHIDY